MFRKQQSRLWTAIYPRQPANQELRPAGMVLSVPKPVVLLISGMHVDKP